MFSFLLIVFQLFFVLMLGVFYRSSSYNALDSQYVTLGLVTILGFVLMSSTYRKLSLFSLLLLLFISFFTIEVNLLFMTFWSSCFTSFSKQVTMSTSLLVNSVFAALGVILTCMDFVGLFEYWQIFSSISFIMTIGYGLCSAITVYGLDTFDGGCCISVFLFSGMCSLMIWLLSVRGKISILQHRKSQSYINYTLGFVGVAIALFSWPVLNMGGSSLTFLNTNLSSQQSLANSAYVNTISALGVSLILSSILSSTQTQSQKQRPKVYIECFINAGIIVSSFNDVSLHPVTGMTLALVSTIVTVLADKYLVAKTTVRNESDFKMVLMKFSKILFRIVWSLVSVCVGAIVVTTRDDTGLWLLSDSGKHSTKAGLMIAAWLIGLGIGAVFGVICAVCINGYLSYRLSSSNEEKVISIVDELFFQDMESQIFPLYTDILQVEPDKTYEEDLTRRVLHESLILQQQIPTNIYQSTKKQSHQTSHSKQIQKETLLIKNDFSRSNLNIDKREINLSTMKLRKDEVPIAVENVHSKRFIDVSRSMVSPGYSPIKKLQTRDVIYESLRPAESIAEHPRQLKPTPSSSKLAQIHIVDQSIVINKSSEQHPFPKKKLTFTDHINQDEVEIQGISKINN